MRWSIKAFDSLTLRELYSLLRLRCEIFIVEQVPYQDVDNMDMQAYHVFLSDDVDEVIAYARVFPGGIMFPEAAIGRVCVRKDHRGKGLASELMDRCIAFAEKELGEGSIHISAQRYLTEFYESKGFIPVGEGYDEDGIPHIGMTRRRE